MAFTIFSCSLILLMFNCFNARANLIPAARLNEIAEKVNSLQTTWTVSYKNFYSIVSPIFILNTRNFVIKPRRGRISKASVQPTLLELFCRRENWKFPLTTTTIMTMTQKITARITVYPRVSILVNNGQIVKVFRTFRTKEIADLAGLVDRTILRFVEIHRFYPTIFTGCKRSGYFFRQSMH